MSCEEAQDSPSIHFQPAFSVSRAQLGQLVSRQQQPAAALGTERSEELQNTQYPPLLIF